ncbi:MAG TPA: DUF1259 domain-containing protein [Solirubrobacteraceae bacterium]|jgi:hypothetical protein|nr:DUF1259 domain-containing protein [Solirubrobacteraceae bacterium]
MPNSPSPAAISRRRALALGGGVAAGGLLSAATPLIEEAGARTRTFALRRQHGTLPAKQIQAIVQAEGSVTNGVLSIDVQRSDIGKVSGPLGVTFTPAFEIDGTLTFQPLGSGLAFFNGDIPLRPNETNGFIDALLAHGLTFQAFHQHYTEMKPQVWFIHFRGIGAPLALARAVHAALKATSTPLPQKKPSKPKTPLDAKRLASILHGTAQVGDEGVVTVSVSRRGRIVIGGVVVSPDANISTGIQFKPLSSSGSTAAVGPDFSMTSPEVQKVVALMRKQGWFVGCLYNQETSESPQLYFSHMLKTGDAYALANEVRRGLDLTHTA